MSIVATGSGIRNGTGDLNAGHVVTLTLMMNQPQHAAGGGLALTTADH